jgi:hypothetical protein
VPPGVPSLVIIARASLPDPDCLYILAYTINVFFLYIPTAEIIIGINILYHFTYITTGSSIIVAGRTEKC